MAQGGFDAEFVEEVADYLKCIICHMVLQDPLLLVDCGHRLCSSCFAGLHRHANERKINVYCPYDRTVVRKNKVVLDRGIARVVLDLQVKCDKREDGCEWIGELRNLQDHLDSICTYTERKSPEPASLEEAEATVNLINGIPGGDDGGESCWSLGVGCMVSSALVIAAIGWYYFCTATSQHDYRGIAQYKMFIDIVERDFPTQNENIWHMLQNSGQGHLGRVEAGIQFGFTPINYLIAGYADSGATIDCFVRRLAESFIQGKEKRIQSWEFRQDDNKNGLDSVLQTTLNGSTMFVSVKDIEMLPFIVAQSFMSHIGVSSGSFPKPVLALTTVLPFSYDPTKQPSEDKTRVREYFQSKVWGDAHKDFTELLWSRIARMLILIRREDKHICVSSLGRR